MPDRRNQRNGYAQNSWEAYEAVGCAMALRAYLGSLHPPIVVCHAGDGPHPLVELARKLGVVFLTPDELVARIEAKVSPDE